MSEQTEQCNSIDSVSEFLHEGLNEPDEVYQSIEATKRILQEIIDSDEEKERKVQKVSGALSDDELKLFLMESKLAHEAYLKDKEKSRQELEALEERYHNTLARQKAMRNSPEVIEAEKRATELKKQLIEELITSQFKGLRAICELYRSVTGVEWARFAEPHKCEGYVSKEGDAVPFSLDKTQSTAFFIANHLWNLMDDDARAECS